MADEQTGRRRRRSAAAQHVAETLEDGTTVAEGGAAPPPQDAVADAPPDQQRAVNPADLLGYRKLDPRRLTGGLSLMPLIVLFGLNAVDELDRQAFSLLTPEIQDHFNLSIQGILTLTAIVAPVGLIIGLPIGYWGDRLNRMRMAAAAAFVWAVCSFLTGFAGFAGGLWLMGIARAGSIIGRQANDIHNSLISDFYPPEYRARVFYAHRLANSVGQFVAPLVAGTVALWIGWQYPFFIFTLPTLVFIALTFKVKEPRRGVHERRAAGADEETANTEEVAAGFAETFRVLFNNRSARRIYASLPFFTASLFGFQQFLAIFYRDAYGLNSAQRGTIFAATEPIQIVGLLVGGIFVQRIMRRDPALVMKLLGFTAIGSAAFLALLAVSPNLPIAIIGHLGNSAISGMLTPGVIAVISLAVPPRMRSLGFATGNLFFLLGFAALPIVGGIADRSDVRFGILVFIPVYLTGSFLLASAGNFINNDIKKIQQSSLAQAEVRRRRLEGDPQILVIRELDVSYDQTQVLFNIDFEVSDGEIIALLGTNGAGKSTLLKAISGVLMPDAGAVIFDGIDVTNSDTNTTARLGITQVPGGRGIFPSLTVGENLRCAGWLYRKDSAYLKEATKTVLEYFPILERRWDTAAGSLSGGEQQMLSLAQAFIARPKLLMIDELSLGLAPTIVERLLDIVTAIHQRGTSIILVEQSVNVALRIAKRAVFMEKGEVRFTGPTSELLERTDILRSVFLEGAASGMAMADGAEAENGQKKLGARARRADRARRAALLEKPVALETIGLTKRYGGVTAVNGVDLQLHQDQILGLIGPNGAGKTTIFDCISGFIPINGGRVILDGVDVTEWPSWRRAEARLSRSFQDARLWPSLTVKEALGAAMKLSMETTNPLPAIFGLPLYKDSERRIDRKVEEVIDMLGLGAFRDKFISELSTGSRRMVEIGTLLANDPKVIVLDEPSSGIAQKETEALGPLLRAVQRYTGCAILIIEHDMPLISSLADHIVALEQGTVVTVDVPEVVLNHPRVVEAYLGNTTYDDLTGEVAAAEVDEVAAIEAGDGEPVVAATKTTKTTRTRRKRA